MTFTRLAAALVAFLLVPAAAAQTYEAVGRIDNLVPAAFHTPPGGQQLEARQLDPVVRDETLTTTDKGGLVVTFADGSELTLGANSTAQIDEFVYPGPGQGNATIELVSGVFRFVSGQMDEAGVKVESPTASIGIRGTVIYVVVFKDGTTIQITDRGRAQVTSKATGRTVTVDEESGVSVDKAGVIGTPVSFSDGLSKSQFDNPELMLALVPGNTEEAYPSSIEMLPSGSTKSPPSGRQYNLAKPQDVVMRRDDKAPYLAAYFLWDRKGNGSTRAGDLARARVTSVMTRRTGEIGSAAGRATGGLPPSNRANDVVVGVYVSTSPLAQSEWVVTQGDPTIHFAQGPNYGPIAPPGGGTIVSLNNANVAETVMVKTFTLGAGDRLFSVSGLANFVTTEFPDYVGDGFNDNVEIILRTPGGQEVELSQLFGASVDESTFTNVTGMPAPLQGYNAEDGAGQTGWKSFFNRLRVAAGGQVTIEVRIRNQGDTDYPSTILLNDVVGSGTR